MSNTVKLVLYAGLIICAAAFGFCFYHNYSNFMREAGEREAPAKVVNTAPGTVANGTRFSHLIYFGGAFFVTVLALGFMVGHDFSHLAGERFGKLLFNEDGETIKKSGYEEAEEVWTDGNPLEAIQMMRDYLKQNPREQHVALRIAEIYEKDLNNPLAAALEYEEVLRQKLSAEQWGWTAIHLCNLYANKLNQGAKSNALLHRICNEYGDTAAAEKARKRLDMIEGAQEGEVPEELASSSEPAPPAGPPKPDNSNLQMHFEKFHRGTTSVNPPPS